MPELLQPRVALVGPTHPAPGGIVHFTQGLAATLAAGGETLVVGWKRRFPEFLYPGTISDATSTTVVSAVGEPMLDLLDPRSWRRAARAILAFRPDVVVLQWWHPLHAPVIGALERRLRRAGIPVTIICHNVEPHESNALWRTLTRRTLRRADRLVVHGESLVAQARRMAPTVPVTRAFLPISVNVATATGPAWQQDIIDIRRRTGTLDRPLLLTFGYVRPYKGVEDAIAALPRCSRRPVLLVAGECWQDPQPFYDLARDHGVQDDVIFDLRYIPNDELPALFGAADAVVLPYRDATQSGVAALAFAYGRPVVATAVGGLPDLIDDGVTGALAPPNDPAGLADAIDRVISDGRDWAPAIASLRERLSWERYVELLLDGSCPNRPRKDANSHAILDVDSRESKAAKIIAILSAEHALDGLDVVDIGTGNGTIAAALARAAGAHGSCTSLDVADVRVTRDGYRFVRYAGERLPLADRCCDLVVSNHVLEHVGGRPAQIAHLREIARLLRPGGRAYVALPHRWQLIENHYRLPLLGWLPRPLADRYVRRLRGVAAFDIHALGRRELQRLMGQAGLPARDATDELIAVSLLLGHERSARILRRLPGATGLLRGPLLPTIVAIGDAPGARPRDASSD